MWRERKKETEQINTEAQTEEEEKIKWRETENRGNGEREEEEEEEDKEENNTSPISYLTLCAPSSLQPHHKPPITQITQLKRETSLRRDDVSLRLVCRATPGLSALVHQKRNVSDHEQRRSNHRLLFRN
ncbi:unnamed protein product [Pleuronectes platessa]|uniref:Uncharacterized protein n=1 Tax=Pleuronectes platessa TaxID=8262 RepID=A0A9N7YRD4_PLEPL|nr:unnamed protein product [Pleuronectes platessa]